MTEISGFDNATRDAQLRHSQGDWSVAAEGWTEALGEAPDQSEYGRALRGWADSTFRKGQASDDFLAQETGISGANNALLIHGNILRAAQDDPEVASETMVTRWREHAESARVRGMMAISQALDGERKTGKAQVGGVLYARRQFGVAAANINALNEHRQRESDTTEAEPSPDQYEINLAPYQAFGEIFAPDRNSRVAARLARRAREFAWQSESPELPTSANLGRVHRAKAVAKSVIRAYAATAANRIATPTPSLRRKAAVRIATLPGVL